MWCQSLKEPFELIPEKRVKVVSATMDPGLFPQVRIEVPIPETKYFMPQDFKELHDNMSLTLSLWRIDTGQSFCVCVEKREDYWCRSTLWNEEDIQPNSICFSPSVRADAGTAVAIAVRRMQEAASCRRLHAQVIGHFEEIREPQMSQENPGTCSGNESTVNPVFRLSTVEFGFLLSEYCHRREDFILSLGSKKRLLLLLEGLIWK